MCLIFSKSKGWRLHSHFLPATLASISLNKRLSTRFGLMEPNSSVIGFSLPLGGAVVYPIKRACTLFIYFFCIDLPEKCHRILEDHMETGKKRKENKTEDAPRQIMQIRSSIFCLEGQNIKMHASEGLALRGSGLCFLFYNCSFLWR